LSTFSTLEGLAAELVAEQLQLSGKGSKTLQQGIDTFGAGPVVPTATRKAESNITPRSDDAGREAWHVDTGYVLGVRAAKGERRARESGHTAGARYQEVALSCENGVAAWQVVFWKRRAAR
jgi:hypothetical protein